MTDLAGRAPDFVVPDPWADWPRSSVGEVPADVGPDFVRCKPCGGACLPVDGCERGAWSSWVCFGCRRVVVVRWRRVPGMRGRDPP